jgi:NADH:ubiquinone oxidoreductase subunit F (NADH-binding)/NADH:ubiquinone oxidoreductase subunit E
LATLIEEMMRLQQREGWLSPEGLRELAGRLSLPLYRLEGAASFYTHFRREPPKKFEIEVCRDLSCRLAGGNEACERLRAALGARADVEISEVSCIGRCDSAPAANIGDRTVRTSDTDAAVSALETPVDAPARRVDWKAADLYREPGAVRYEALRRGLRADRDQLSAQLEESGLRGMGGAGFPTGRKWALVAAEPGPPESKYVICNADESEPGTFKDREILRDLAEVVIEGMVLAAYCIGAERGWVFIRHEYEPEREQLAIAIESARQAGALGSDIFGSGFDFDIEIFVSPGGYILGEETALLECMEGRRGEPRNKPPYPGVQGLHGCPTLINNVETFAHATGILKNGVDWWRSLGAAGFTGHKFISVSGDVAEPGVHLVPMGTTLRSLLSRCGGMREGQRLAAIAPGGASSNFLSPEHLDVPLDFETLERAGSMLGSGAVVFVGDGANLLEVGLNVTRFFRNESCGKCVPCRVGTEKAVQLFESVEKPTGEQRATIADLNATLARTSICGLGQVALGPLLSILENFSEPGDG